ncbi:transcriptional regulator [Spirochaetia bacterium]|nr:transcriptional regulator [Spirochaetia bacterium]
MKKSLIRLITVLYRKSQSYLSVALSKHNLTTAEQPFFAALQKYDGITQEELSTLICVDKAATARALNSLEKKGYVKRVQDQHDKRQNKVFLTTTARKHWPAVERELIRFNELLIKNIDKNSLETIYNSLLQMEENATRCSLNKNSIIEKE